MTKRTKRKKQTKTSPIQNQDSVVKLIKFCLLIILATFIYNKYTTGLAEHPFHEDEQHFTRKSYYFDLFFVHPDLTNPNWSIYDSPAQPKFGSYIYGAVFHLNGIKDIPQKLRETRFSDYRWVYLLKNRPLTQALYDTYPQLELILIARKAAIYFTFLAFLTIFLFSFKTKGFLYALIATGLLSANSLMVQFGKRAMTDFMQLLGFFLTLILTQMLIHFEKTNQENKMYWTSIGLGASVAFAVGVKVSGSLIIFFLCLIFPILACLRIKQKQSLIPILKCALLSAVIFTLIFVPLHPFLYSNPITQFIDMFTQRIEWAEGRRLIDSATAIYTPLTTITLIVYRTLMPFGKFTNFRNNLLPVDAFFFLTGLWALGKNASRSWKNQRVISPELILLVWNLVVITGLMVYLRNDWLRYYLPIVSVITITQAYSLTTIIQFSWEKLSKTIHELSIIK